MWLGVCVKRAKCGQTLDWYLFSKPIATIMALSDAGRASKHLQHGRLLAHWLVGVVAVVGVQLDHHFLIRVVAVRRIRQR